MRLDSIINQKTTYRACAGGVFWAELTCEEMNEWDALMRKSALWIEVCERRAFVARLEKSTVCHSEREHMHALEERLAAQVSAWYESVKARRAEAAKKETP